VFAVLCVISTKVQQEAPLARRSSTARPSCLVGVFYDIYQETTADH